MLFASGILFALQVVVAQSLYKAAVDKAEFELTTDFLFSTKLIGMVLSWQFLLGLSLFFLATGINFWMFTKWNFSSIQAVTVPFILAFSILIGWKFFNESVSIINIAGIGVMIIGVVLATYATSN